MTEMRYELNWIMHNLSDVPPDQIPACGECNGKMNIETTCEIVGDYPMHQLFIAELGHDAAYEMSKDGLFEFAMDSCFCPKCDVNDDDEVYNYHPLANVRWYWNGSEYCNGVLELPDEQRKRKQSEYRKRQKEAGQMTLPFPKMVNTDE